MTSKFKKLAAAVLKPIAEPVFAIEASIAEKWVSAAHHRSFLAQWRLPPAPEYFEHKLDLYWYWRKSRNSLWVERGVYSSLAINSGASVLELCCGDGFNAYFFYSKKADTVIAVDFDAKPIRYAHKHFGGGNIVFKVADIRSEIPAGDFDNIVWDAAIEHFTEAEIPLIMSEIKDRLARKKGVLSGYTLVEREDHTKHLHQHEYEFKSKEDLLRFLQPHFKHVTVFETIYPERHNLYFWASDERVPFATDWPKKVSSGPNQTQGIT